MPLSAEVLLGEVFMSSGPIKRFLSFLHGRVPHPSASSGFGSGYFALRFRFGANALPNGMLHIPHAYIRCKTFYLVALGFTLFLGGCCYSFTSKTVDSRIKTLSIETLQNQAEVIVPALNFELTEAIRETFLRQTSLKSVNKDGDFHFSGVITRYYITPIAIQGSQTPSQNRLTMNVKINFTHKYDETKNYEFEFSNFVDFPATSNLVSIQTSLNAELNKKLAQDIFNKTLGDW